VYIPNYNEIYNKLFSRKISRYPIVDFILLIAEKKNSHMYLLLNMVNIFLATSPQIENQSYNRKTQWTTNVDLNTALQRTDIVFNSKLLTENICKRPRVKCNELSVKRYTYSLLAATHSWIISNCLALQAAIVGTEKRNKN